MIFPEGQRAPGRYQPAFYDSGNGPRLHHEAAAPLEALKKPRMWPWAAAFGVSAITAAVMVIAGNHEEVHELIKPALPPIEPDAQLDRFPVTGESDALSHQRAVVETVLQPHTLSTQEIRQLLFFSFQHSQGRPDIQVLIFHILKDQHPEWIFPADLKVSTFSQEIVGGFHNRVLDGSHIGKLDNTEITRKDVLKDVKENLALFKRILSEQKITANHALAERMDVLQRIIEIDRHYLINGRPSGKEFSYVVEYLIENHKVPGGPVYEQLYGTLRGDLKTLLSKDDGILNDAEKARMDDLETIFALYRIEIGSSVAVPDDEMRMLLIKHGFIKG